MYTMQSHTHQAYMCNDVLIYSCAHTRILVQLCTQEQLSVTTHAHRYHTYAHMCSYQCIIIVMHTCIQSCMHYVQNHIDSYIWAHIHWQPGHIYNRTHIQQDTYIIMYTCKQCSHARALLHTQALTLVRSVYFNTIVFSDQTRCHQLGVLTSCVPT